MSDNSRTSSGQPLFARLATWVRERWIEPVRRARRRRAELAMLMHLDERTLDDIGLSRADLLAAAYHDVPLERLVAKRRTTAQAKVVPLTRAPAQPARDLDVAA